MSSALHTGARATIHFLADWLLPLGYLCLLTGLAWLDDRSQYHKVFYALIAAPALVALVLQPRLISQLLRNPITLALLAFSAWILLSLTWSDTEESIGSLIKRPLYVLMLFVACLAIAQRNCSRLIAVVGLSSLLMVPIAVYALVDFTRHYSEGARLVGSGALDNPLLSSHVFGFFCLLWLGWAMTAPGRQSLAALLPLAVLLATLLATGSRTPILAAALAAGWLIISTWNLRALALAMCGAIGVLLLWLLYPESFLNRGTSYRLEIWQLALEQILQHPWVGHGFDAHLAIKVPGIDNAFSEPHSFFLGVLYYSGLVGAILWLLMHAAALQICWKRRQDLYFIIAGALVIYGLGAGLAEGGGILSRPKEHWFLIWIPLALVAALSIGRQQKASVDCSV